MARRHHIVCASALALLIIGLLICGEDVLKSRVLSYVELFPSALGS